MRHSEHSWTFRQECPLGPNMAFSGREEGSALRLNEKSGWGKIWAKRVVGTWGQAFCVWWWTFWGKEVTKSRLLKSSRKAYLRGWKLGGNIQKELKWSSIHAWNRGGYGNHRIRKQSKVLYEWLLRQEAQRIKGGKIETKARMLGNIWS